jgi:hypothetical protein
VIKKNNDPPVKTCGGLAYLLQREKGVHIFFDHANVINIFSPDKEVKAHIRVKHHRWVMKVCSVTYEIAHVNGEDNVWADLISRWGQPIEKPTKRVCVLRIMTRQQPTLSPLRPL